MRIWLLDALLSPVIRPVTRLLVAQLAIPVVRSLSTKVAPDKKWDDELQKDVEQWIRGSLLLCVATANFEIWLKHLLDLKFQVDFDPKENVLIFAGRLLVAVGVVETMPDQQLFSIIHPGPPPFKSDPKKSWLGNFLGHLWPMCRGIFCQHLNRSSSVFAIMAVIFAGQVGWICFGLAITQYLIIGLVTSRDRAIDVLQAFDREIAVRREQLLTEFDLEVAEPVPLEPTRPRPPRPPVHPASANPEGVDE